LYGEGTASQEQTSTGEAGAIYDGISFEIGHDLPASHGPTNGSRHFNSGSLLASQFESCFELRTAATP
jgi:hypothetical protein